MQKFNGSLIRQFPSLVTGNAADGVQVTVYVSGTNTLATIYEDNEVTPKGNPVTTAYNGFYSFKAADGKYRLQFSSSQFPALEIQLVDVDEIRQDFDDLQGAFDDFVLSQGWDQVGSFTVGFTFTSPNQVGQDSSGNWWRWNGSLPKTVTAGTLPSSDANYKLVGDGVLRSDLANGNADIGGVLASTLASYHTFDPLEYGLKESNAGQQNTVALTALSAAINAFLTSKPSGKVYVPFPSGDYLIGDQAELVSSWSPSDNFIVRDFPNATVYLHYHGTKLKWRDGLRYGNVSGKTANIGGMIRLINVGDIYMSGVLETDGNDVGAVIGSLAGQDYSDYGMELFQYRRLFMNAKIYMHNHLLDGLYTNGLYADDGYTYVEGVTSLFNGRQSHSHVGGKNTVIRKVIYGQTGNGRVNISPAAGLQVEAEGATIGDVTVEDSYIQPCKGACVGVINGVDFQVVGKIRMINSEFENNLYTPLATQHKNTVVDNCTIRGCLTEFGPPSAGIVLTDSIRPIIKNSTLTDRMRDGTFAYRRSGEPAAGGGILWEGLSSRFDLIDCKGFATINETFWTIGNATGCNIDGFDLYVTGVATPLTNKEVFRVNGVDYFNNFTLYNQLSGAQAGDLTCYITVTNAAKHENNRIDTSSGAFSTSIIWGGASIAAGGRAGAIFDKDNNNFRARNFLAMYREGTNISIDQAGAARIFSYAAVPADGKSFIRGDLIVNNTTSPSGIPAWSCTTSGVAGSTAVFKPFSNLGA